MNKTQMIDHIAKHADLSKAAATRALEAFTGGVRQSLKSGEGLALVGFGAFTVSKRAARTGRNPQSGESIKIKASTVPKFRPAQSLKDALNSKR